MKPKFMRVRAGYPFEGSHISWSTVSQNRCCFSGKITLKLSWNLQIHLTKQTHFTLNSIFSIFKFFPPNKNMGIYLPIFKFNTRNTYKPTFRVFELTAPHRFRMESSHQEAAGISSLGLWTAKACKAQVSSPPTSDGFSGESEVVVGQQKVQKPQQNLPK